MANRGGVPPGQAKKDGASTVADNGSGPPGQANKGGVPPGQAKKDGASGLADSGSGPPGLANKGGVPPGQAKKDGASGLADSGSGPPGLANKGGVPPGQAKKDGASGLADNGSGPPGLANKGGVPPGQAKKDAGPPGLADNGGSSPGLPQTDGPPAIVVVETGGAGDASSGAGAVIFVPKVGDPAQASAQASLGSSPDPGGESPPQATASNARGESDQQQKVTAALSSGLLEFSRTGAIVRKGQILALAPTPASITIARGMGYALVERLTLDDLGLRAVVLRAPSDLTADEALGRLQSADPRGGYSLNPIYTPTGRIGSASGAASGFNPRATRAGPGAGTVAVGLIDTGVFAQHPALAGARLEQQGFAPGGLTAAKHGTAVASIAAGQSGDFHGVAPGSRIYVADVYGQTGAGGSASAVAEGIDWLVRRGAPVINISLVGPPNKLTEAAVQAAIRKGVIIVAAVGNDGPNSPPLYPAAYRGVVAVTAVDQQDRILFEAVRATPVAFAAPGADIFAADGVGGFAKVRGTSFAAPIVAGQLALGHRRLDGKDAVAAIQKLKRAAKAPADAAFGFGIVGEDARLALRPGLSHITTAQARDWEPNKE
ncbi:MAG: S8 family serine peptidase [Caulobacteraceae bacterium]